eukprot:CAMPEP_0198335626 /NCGR_PEP_ID=MMETSP1450-20131203/20440_1 /TAXON_ID=753684 ORGANISM="Madagascaria erythrocladiodes, Strain CCMP3234" /NCGR_SAMPLE_ID=MMETSP1450 /ASSEMBLY_ACC=CAM_ASM_001115 /LENGTH=49 /DNA_ID=CAMNT_0044040307 /DNA_START=26 /DNA_END=175 /DNA_ORIENTATION=-
MTKEPVIFLDNAQHRQQQLPDNSRKVDACRRRAVDQSKAVEAEWKLARA